MPLPLTVRKSLRDNQEILDEAVEKIKNATGVEWTFEFDIENIIEKADADYLKNDAGNFFYKEVAANVAYNIENLCKDETTKEALVEACTENKVILRINTDKKNTDYWKYIFENGSLVLLMRTPPANTGDISYFNIAKVIPTPGVFSLVARLNIKAAQEKIDEAFESIKSVTKEDWCYDEASLETVYGTIDKSYQESIGDIFREVIESIAYNITKRCADDMILEAFSEVTTNKKIVFVHNPKQSDYWAWKFTNGDLVVSFKSICNVNDNSYFDFEKLL
eukprot:gene16721-19875_t